MTTHRIIIERVGRMYRATYNGAVLVAGSRAVEFDACRALAERGIRGTLEVWRSAATSPAMRLDIERAAKCTVVEEDKRGLRFVRWRPFSRDGKPDALSRGEEAVKNGRLEVGR
jgi:hypothetical protein